MQNIWYATPMKEPRPPSWPTGWELLREEDKLVFLGRQAPKHFYCSEVVCRLKTWGLDSQLLSNLLFYVEHLGPFSYYVGPFNKMNSFS